MVQDSIALTSLLGLDFWRVNYGPRNKRETIQFHPLKAHTIGPHIIAWDGLRISRPCRHADWQSAASPKEEGQGEAEGREMSDAVLTAFWCPEETLSAIEGTEVGWYGINMERAIIGPFPSLEALEAAAILEGYRLKD
jgi:hypothetical protein